MAIIIVAGGGGTRLWPISTEEKPKQFVELINGKSLLRYTFDNLLKEFDKNELWVITGEQYEQVAIECLGKDFDRSHLILEPEKRNTYPAVISAASVVSKEVGDKEPLIFLPCDDYLFNSDSISKFNEAQALIYKEIKNGLHNIVIAGVKSKWGNPQYGYIRYKNALSKVNIKYIKRKSPLFKVLEFREKPDFLAADKYHSSGEYLWNKFNFAFTYSNLLKVLELVDSDAVEVLEKLSKNNILDKENYRKLEKISFDHKVLENKSVNISVLPINIDWTDLGSFESLSLIEGSGFEQIYTNKHSLLLSDGSIDYEDFLDITSEVENFYHLSWLCYKGKAYKI